MTRQAERFSEIFTKYELKQLISLGGFVEELVNERLEIENVYKTEVDQFFRQVNS